MIKVLPEELVTKLGTSNLVFHMESGYGWIKTYGASTAPVNSNQVYVEDHTGFIDVERHALKAENDANVATITINDNLLAPCNDTQELTITMWIFISDMEKDAAFYPFKFGNNGFYIDSKTFIFRTEHYYTGITYKNVLPNNKWCHICLTINNTDHGKSRLSLYVDGRLISTGYTEWDYNVGTSPSTSTAFGVDFNAMTSSSFTNTWEFLGKSKMGAYMLREFSIYKKDLVGNAEEFIVPKVATVGANLMTLTNRTFIGYKIVGSNDPHPLSTAGPQFGLMTYSGGIALNLTNPNQIDPLFYYEDHNQYMGTITKTFTLSGWTGNVDMSSGVAKGLVSIDIIVRYIKHVTQDQSQDLIKPGTQYESQDGIKNFSGQIKFYLNGTLIKKSSHFYKFDKTTGYGLVNEDSNIYYNGVDDYFEYHDKITELVYISSPNTLVIETGSMPINNQRVWVRHFEGDVPGGFAKCSIWDIWSRLVVPMYWKHVEFPCSLFVDNTGYGQYTETVNPDGTITKKKWRITLPIPFPYPQFTEMEWILIAPDGRFVPEVYYDRIDDYHIRFKDWNPFNIGYDEEFKFTFLHKHGFYAVNKYEQNEYAKKGINEYQFNSPYDSIVDLQKRVKVFVNCEFLNPDLDLYRFDNDTGIIQFTNKFTFSDDDLITFLCFYTGTKQSDGTIARLPMSGYVEFRTPYEDRVWDKNTFAIFMNGKLLHRDLITDMSSTIHKINQDIKTRYNLEVLNMAPRISYLTPYILAAHKRIDTKSVDWEWPCKLTVPYDEFYKPRHHIEPDIFNPVEWLPVVPQHMDWYITLIHHGLNKAQKDYQQNLEYSLTFYRSQYVRDPESVMVVGQARLKGNIEEFYPDSATNTLLCMLPSKLTQTDEDEVLFSIQAKTILMNDTEINFLDYQDSIDGIMCRLEMLSEKKDQWFRVYYELYCDNYERDTEIEILEWVISSEPNAKGDIWYRKTIPFIPYDEPNFPPMDDMPEYP